MLPITAKLLPTSVRNLSYMLQIAFLTRLTIGLARIWQNRPSNQKEKHLSLTDKKVNMGERAFVEIIGTLAAVLPLHLVQDLVAKVYEWKARIPKIASHELPGVAADKLKLVNEAIVDVFGKNGKDNPSGIIHRLLYGVWKGGGLVKSSLGTLHDHLVSKLGAEEGGNLFKAVYPRLEAFAVRNNRVAAIAVGLGILAGALSSGPVIQRINDYWLSPRLARRFKSAEKGPASNPSSSDAAPQEPLVPPRQWLSSPGPAFLDTAVETPPAFSAVAPASPLSQAPILVSPDASSPLPPVSAPTPTPFASTWAATVQSRLTGAGSALRHDVPLAPFSPPPVPVRPASWPATVWPSRLAGQPYGGLI